MTEAYGDGGTGEAQPPILGTTSSLLWRCFALSFPSHSARAHKL